MNIFFSPHNPYTHEMNSLTYKIQSLIPGTVQPENKKFSA